MPADRAAGGIHPDDQRVSFAPRKDGHVPSYRVRPGEHLVMRIAVTVPKHVKITALWFGISAGTWVTARAAQLA